jgi:hypothetical protein
MSSLLALDPRAYSLPGPTGTMIVCRRWLPIWSATTSPLSQRRFRPRRRLRPIQFLENNPIQSSLWVRFMCPQTRRNWLRLPIVRFHPGVQLPPAAALRRGHTRGRRPPPFPRDSCVSWHTVNLRSAASSAIIRTSEHFHVFSPPPRLSVRMFGSGGKKRANASSNCAAL